MTLGRVLRLVAPCAGAIFGLATVGQAFTLWTESFTVTSADSVNVLEWFTLPLPFYDHTKIRYRLDGTCPTDPPPLDTTSIDLVIPTPPGPAAKGQVQHAVTNRAITDPSTICYAAWIAVDPAELALSQPLFARGRPFDTSGPAKWAFSTGATAVVPPGIGSSGVYVPSNDRALYGIGRGTDVLGSGAGLWLGNFNPLRFQQPIQSRPPTVPIDIGPANPVTFATSQDGNVIAIDANQGDAVPANNLLDPIWATPIATAVQAAPAAWLQAFGGAPTGCSSARASPRTTASSPCRRRMASQTNLPNGQVRAPEPGTHQRRGLDRLPEQACLFHEPRWRQPQYRALPLVRHGTGT